MSETAHIPLETPQLLLEHHLKALRLPTMLREYDRVARQCAAEDIDYPRYLLRMTELELLFRLDRLGDQSCGRCEAYQPSLMASVTRLSYGLQLYFLLPAGR